MNTALHGRIVLFGILIVLAPAWAVTGHGITRLTLHSHLSLRPGHAAIASANALATRAGFSVLDKGGNAFDAAVAMAAMLSVVEPESSGLGGGFFAILHLAREHRNVFLDAREVAPAAVHSRDYASRDGSIKLDTALKGPLSAAIPGEPAGLVWLSRHYGRLPLKVALAPAIRAANQGFKPGARLLGVIKDQEQSLRRWPASAAKFLPAGRLPLPGKLIRDPNQARTLKWLAAKGNAGFYHGEVAKKLVNAVRKAGGNWTLADLAHYRVKERKPVTIHYHGYRIVTVAPPSSGGVTLAEMFNILSGYKLGKMDQAHRAHYMVEAMRRAYRDRNDYLGDPDFVKMPLSMLQSAYYAAGLRASILPDKATPSTMLPHGLTDRSIIHSTTHFSIIDHDGNMIALTSSLNYYLGSNFVAKGTGIVLNDTMDDFALVPGKSNAYGLTGSKANAPQGGKRPLSSMSPSIVFGPKRTLVIGSPGGATIITQVLEGTLHFIHGQHARTLVSDKRFHDQFLPDMVFVENGTFNAATSASLKKMGYTLKLRKPWGAENVVIWNRKTNKLDAASDPRRVNGLAIVQ